MKIVLWFALAIVVASIHPALEIVSILAESGGA